MEQEKKKERDDALLESAKLVEDVLNPAEAETKRFEWALVVMDTDGAVGIVASCMEEGIKFLLLHGMEHITSVTPGDGRLVNVREN